MTLPPTPSVAEFLISGLREAGTPRLFGVPGAGSKLLEAGRAQGLPFVPCQLDSAAAIMAAVTGELTETPGAVLARLGSRAPELASGVMYALLARAPLILLTERESAGGEGFAIQEGLDPNPFFSSVKGSLLVAPASAAQQIAWAVRLALADPRGPVHLDVPADVAGRLAAPGSTSQALPSLPPPDTEALDRAAEVIRQAHYPVLTVGLECRGAEEAKWLRALAESIPAPVLTTHKAKGILPDSHPLALGLCPGGAREQALVGRADLIVTIGLDPVELADRGWSSPVPVVHLARTPHLGHAFVPAAQVTGDIGLIIEELAPRLRRRTRANWDVALLDRLKRQRMEGAVVSAPGLSPDRVVQIARELAPAGSVVAVDGEAWLVAAAAFWQAEEPGTFLIPSRQPSQGFALPAAIAAQLVRRDCRVLSLTGARGLIRAVAELETVVRLSLPIIIVVLDDRALGSAPEIPAVAHAFRIPTFRAEREDELCRTLEQALGASRPALVAARVASSR